MVIAAVLIGLIVAGFWPESTYVNTEPSPEVAASVLAAQKAMEGYTDATTMVFADPVIETAICRRLGKEKGTVTVGDMRTIRSFKYPDVYEKSDEKDIGYSIKTLEDFRYCENLESIEANRQLIDNLESLRCLKKLNKIDLSFNRISDLSPLADMGSLHTLFVSYNPIRSIKGLRGQKSIVTIDIKYCPITDISPLEGMDTLQALYMGEDSHYDSLFSRLFQRNQPATGQGSLDKPQEYDLSALGNTSRLKYFHLIGKPKDIAPLLGHKGLEIVELEGLESGDFAALMENCKELMLITLKSSSIRMSSLASIGDKMYGLIISNSDITGDAPVLPCPTNMNTLTIANCNVSDISALAGLTKLETLALVRSEIKDITPLAGLKALKLLYLHSNKIEDITPLTGLKTLTRLDLQANSISDFTPLLDLPALKHLGAENNPYADDNAFRELEMRGCEVEYGYNSLYGGVEEAN